jgi:hypothetical protein
MNGQKNRRQARRNMEAIVRLPKERPRQHTAQNQYRQHGDRKGP